MTTVFLDTVGLIALWDEADQRHDAAQQAFAKLQQGGYVGVADDLFRFPMGDNVEPRREFIQKHVLDVRNLDV